MAALRSSLRMLSRGSSVSSGAAYMGGRGMELNQVLRRAAPPPHTTAIRNFDSVGISPRTKLRVVGAHGGKGLNAVWKTLNQERDGEFTLRIQCSFWGHRLPSSYEDAFEDEDTDGIIKLPGWSCTFVVSWSVLFILVYPFVE